MPKIRDIQEKLSLYNYLIEGTKTVQKDEKKR
jgi:hypothetical protein